MTLPLGKAALLGLVCCAVIATNVDADPTYQQKQYYEHQKRLELEASMKRQADEIRRRGNQDREVMERQQRERMQQSQQAGSGAPPEQRRGVGQSSSNADQNSVNRPLPPIPAPINARTEADAEKVVAYIGSWAQRVSFFGDSSTRVQVMGIEQGSWRDAATYGMINEGCVALEDEFKLLVYAERLASLASTPEDKKKAAILMARMYASVDADIIPAARDIWSVGLPIARTTLPDVADMLEEQLINPTDALRDDFIKPRAAYWQAKTK